MGRRGSQPSASWRHSKRIDFFWNITSPIFGKIWGEHGIKRGFALHFLRALSLSKEKQLDSHHLQDNWLPASTSLFTFFLPILSRWALTLLLVLLQGRLGYIGFHFFFLFNLFDLELEHFIALNHLGSACFFLHQGKSYFQNTSLIVFCSIFVTHYMHSSFLLFETPRLHVLHGCTLKLKGSQFEIEKMLSLDCWFLIPINFDASNRQLRR